MLSISKSKLAAVLEQSSDIPADVTFKVYDEEGKVDIFHAHKYYLALVSDVLKTRFFGSLRETSDTLVVRDTTAQAFETMINFVYHKNCQLDKKSVEELFEIVNIAEMYDVAGLMTHVGVAIARVQINLNNVVELARTAEQFLNLSSVSQCPSLFESCLDFLFETMHSHVLDYSGLIISPQNEEIVLKLYNLIKEKPLHFCPYCEEVLWNAQELHFCQHYFDIMMYADDYYNE